MSISLQKVNELNPPDIRYLRMLKDLQEKQYQQQTARQPYIGGWQELNDADYSAGSITSEPNRGVLTVTGYNPKQRFSIGDKIRLKQGGDYKYFYITDITSSTIVVVGDESSALTATAVTDVAISNLNKPVGFPDTLSVTVDLSFGGTWDLGDTISTEVFMQGSLVRYFVEINATISVAFQSISIYMPVERTTTYMSLPENGKVLTAYENTTSPVITLPLVFFNPVSPFEGIASIEKDDGTNFATGDVKIYFDYSYLINLTS